MAARALILPYNSLIWSRLVKALLWVPSLLLANLYMRFSEEAPPVLSISSNLFSYGDKPTTSWTKSRTNLVRLETFYSNEEKQTVSNDNNKIK